MDISDWISGGGLIVSIIALLKSIFTDRKAKELDLQLKQYELERTLLSDMDSKKAYVEVSVLETARGQCNILRFYNKGQAIATNISFDIISDAVSNDIQLNMRPDYLPYPLLHPQQYFEVPYLDFGSQIPHQTIRITWDDDYGKGRTTDVVLDM